MDGERGSDGDGWRDVGEDPDERFTFANERTFLAWNRTALALITAGLVITQLLPELALPGGRQIVGLPLIGTGTVISVLGYRQWVANERAMRLRTPLPHSPLPWLVSAVMTVSAVVALVLVVVEAAA